MREPEENEIRYDSSQIDTDTKAETSQDTIETEIFLKTPEMGSEMAESDQQTKELQTEDFYFDENESFGTIPLDAEDDLEEDLFASLNESLMRQVAEELDAQEHSGTKDRRNGAGDTVGKVGKKQNKILVVIGSIFAVLILFVVFVAATTPGHKFVYWLAGKFISGYTQPGNKDPNEYLNPVVSGTPIPDEPEDPEDLTPIVVPVDHSVRKEDYVKNFLIFGIEEIDGASNTDTIMIASVNTESKTIMLTSILRDMYVELSDGKGRKLNSVYARGRKDGQGPDLLMATIEKYYKIDLEGYAYVNFEAFEKIVDLLGGVTIELGATEAKYLNTTNYISNPANRKVSSGINRLNGNQVVGYCRVRKVPTLGGANNDYGRTVRQRRVLTAIFNEYKSKNIFELLSITTECLSYIHTNLSSTQISELLEMVVENGITTIESARIPIENSYYDAGKKGYNGVTYGLVVNDPAANIKYLFQFLYGDTEEEAEANYSLLD